MITGTVNKIIRDKSDSTKMKRHWRYRNVTVLVAVAFLLGLLLLRAEVFFDRTAIYKIYLPSTSLTKHGMLSLEKDISQTPGRTCWQMLYEDDLRSEGPFELARTTMCAFSPKNPEKEAHLEQKNFTILLIGVHIGPAIDGKTNIPAAGYTFIPLERRDHSFRRRMNGALGERYTPERLAAMQKEFWNTYQKHPAFEQADAIQCGFDTWHCLIFAPFNKKMILNSAYRFEGHFVPDDFELSVKLQSELSKAIRNNPDVILAGTNLYDVMYHQHFFGSHKLVPLPAVGEYTRKMAKIEVEDGDCSTLEWDKDSTTILIGGKRYSEGGEEIVAQLFRKIEALKFNPGERKLTFVQLQKGYKYCSFATYKGVVFFPYSIHSYTMVEVANLAIPIFTPSIKFMAQLEKDYHLLQERKSWLDHGRLDVMTPNSRSMNYGFNPNDDFNKTNIERWLYYTDFSYWEGTIFFDSIDDLVKKFETTDFKKHQEIMERHRLKNLKANRENWQSVVRYLSDGPSTKIPETFDEGMRIWNERKSDLNFDERLVESRIPKTTDNDPFWVIVNKNTIGDYLKTPKRRKRNVLYVAQDHIDKPDLEYLQEKITGVEVQILSVDRQNLLPYRINKWNQTETYSLGILLGVLYLTSKRAEIIEIPLAGQIVDLHAQDSTIFIDPEFWSIIGSVVTKNRGFHQYAMNLWVQRLSTLLTGGSKNNHVDLRLPKDSELRLLSKEQRFILRDLQAYLQHWKTETQKERPNRTFFHIVDQLTFEMAVQGFMRKSDAEIIRDYLLDLVDAGYRVPDLYVMS